MVLGRKYERVTCVPCNGTGRLSKKDGGVHTSRADQRRKPRCSHCQGDGFITRGVSPHIDRIEQAELDRNDGVKR